MKSIHIWVSERLEAEFRQAVDSLASLRIEVAFGALAHPLADAIKVGLARQSEYENDTQVQLSTRIANDLHRDLKRYPRPIGAGAALVLAAHGGQMKESLETRLAELAAEAREEALS